MRGPGGRTVHPVGPGIWPTVRSVVVSGYGLAKVEQDAAVVRPRVDRPGARVPLVLSSYEHVYWQILTTQGPSLPGSLPRATTRPQCPRMLRPRAFSRGTGNRAMQAKGMPRPDGAGAAGVQAIWLYNVARDQAALTYKAQ